MINEKQVQAAMNSLAQQRNSALDALAMKEMQVAELQEKIETLEAKVEELSKPAEG